MPVSSRKPPQQERSRKVERALLRAGLEGIENGGIAGLAMSEVASQAGASIGSLYFRFGDKSQFVGAVLTVALDEFRDQTLALCDEAAREVWPERRILESWVTMMVDVVRRRRVVLREMISYMAAQPTTWNPIHERRREMEERLLSVLAASHGQGRGRGRKIRLRIGLQAVTSMLVHMATVDPGPLRIDSRSAKSRLCDLLFSFIDPHEGKRR